MSATVDKILDDALTLSAAERAALVEKLLSSLGKPDPALDRLWAEEAEARIEAAERGDWRCFSSRSLTPATVWAPYFFVNRSTRPSVSISFCFPVKNGWQLEQISSRTSFFVDRVFHVVPQAQRTSTS